MALDLQKLSLQVAERIRDHATEVGFVPVVSGELRKAHVVQPFGATDALLSANTPYARAVHDGRPAIIIRPKGRKALLWNGAAHPVRAVSQPARSGNPWLRRALDMLTSEGLDFLTPTFGSDVAQELAASLRAQGITVTSTS